jgi:hypothetical protein
MVIMIKRANVNYCKEVLKTYKTQGIVKHAGALKALSKIVPGVAKKIPVSKFKPELSTYRSALSSMGASAKDIAKMSGNKLKEKAYALRENLLRGKWLDTTESPYSQAVSDAFKSMKPEARYQELKRTESLAKDLLNQIKIHQ